MRKRAKEGLGKPSDRKLNEGKTFTRTLADWLYIYMGFVIWFKSDVHRQINHAPYWPQEFLIHHFLHFFLQFVQYSILKIQPHMFRFALHNFVFISTGNNFHEKQLLLGSFSYILRNLKAHLGFEFYTGIFIWQNFILFKISVSMYFRGISKETWSHFNFLLKYSWSHSWTNSKVVLTHKHKHVS